MSAPKEHDAAAVEALAKEVRRIRNEALGCDYPSDLADVAVANAILAREAALVDKAEQLCAHIERYHGFRKCYTEPGHGTCNTADVFAEELRSALAAHRAASAPENLVKEPTLAEAVEAFLLHKGDWEAELREVRSALARERQQVKP